MDVSSIDSHLPSVLYEDWLRKTLGNDAKITWEVNDCGEGGDREGSVPICVTAVGRVGECGEVAVSIAVGSSEDNRFSKPEVWDIYIDGIGPSRSLRDLHLLPELLGESKEYMANPPRLSDRPLDERLAINFVQNIDISTISFFQSHQRFRHWFEKIAGSNNTVTWKLDGCDQVPASMRLSGCHDYRACVSANFTNDKEDVWMLIVVGTYRRGLIGPPKVEKVSVFNKRPSDIRIVTVTIDDLPGKVDEMRRIGRIRE